ncbi:hypothetical protein [Lapillicoccus sp.]|uniref:hypothetical protein n=1 Tax=Lapillicoccus sp. TaxID=1909287 RepID=UPI003983ACBB
MDLDEALTQLYGLRPDEFLAARRRLALAATSGGEPGLAKAIDSMRKPTAAAWAVNLLTRQRPDAVERLLTLAASFHGAHERIDGPALKELGRERTRLVDELMGACAEVVREADGSWSPAVANQVRETFVAALSTTAAADAVASGQLTRALSYAGFGDVDLSEALAAPAPARRPALRVIAGEGKGRDGTTDESEPDPDPNPEPDPSALARLAAAEARSRETMAAAAAAGAELIGVTSGLAQVDARIHELEVTLSEARSQRDALVAARADAVATNKVAERTLRASLAELDEARAALPDDRP